MQGTLYPDVVESGGGSGTANIKSHHNVGGLPEDLTFELVEPLRTLFKDEVRAIGRELGLPEAIVGRQPFPGPGLGIRIVGEVTRERLELLRAADAIAREELTAAGLDYEIWQCPVVLLADVRSVGVQGDGRTYGHPIVLRPVSSEDAMTADWTRLPYDVLARISTRITNEVPGVNRVGAGCDQQAAGHHRVGVALVPRDAQDPQDLDVEPDDREHEAEHAAPLHDLRRTGIHTALDVAEVHHQRVGREQDDDRREDEPERDAEDLLRCADPTGRRSRR